jgi:hypothetical protein
MAATLCSGWLPGTPHVSARAHLDRHRDSLGHRTPLNLACFSDTPTHALAGLGSPPLGPHFIFGAWIGSSIRMPRCLASLRTLVITWEGM